jgi:hypothetical protein
MVLAGRGGEFPGRPDTQICPNVSGQHGQKDGLEQLRRTLSVHVREKRGHARVREFSERRALAPRARQPTRRPAPAGFASFVSTTPAASRTALSNRFNKGVAASVGSRR